jgi:hypothetical protein
MEGWRQAAWLHGNNLEKEERKKQRKNERNGLTLTGLLMEGTDTVTRQAEHQE